MSVKVLMVPMVLLILYAGSARGENTGLNLRDQTLELREVSLEAHELNNKSCDGFAACREPELLKRVVEVKKKMDGYTKTHSGKDLDRSGWGMAFRDVYRLAGTQLAGNYSSAERVLYEGIDLLSAAAPEDAFVAPYVRVLLCVSHVQKHADTNPLECARVWDETGAWVRKTDMPKLTDVWQYYRATTEMRLLCAAAERNAKSLVSARSKIVANYIADETVPMRHRSTALRCFVDFLAARGEAERASQLVEKLKSKDGATPDYYYSRMLVVLFGEGNWEKATDTLDSVNRLGRKGKIAPCDMPLKASDRRMHEMALDLYYGNILLPDIELQRRGRTGIDTRHGHE